MAESATDVQLYLTRCGRKRAYVVARDKNKARELAAQLIGVPSREVSATEIDDDLILDVEAIRGLPDGPSFSHLRP